MIKLFVYGTLKENGALSHRFVPYREDVRSAKVSGRMYDLGHFPGARFDLSGIVKGEVHTYNTDVIPAMDRIESEGVLYNRIKINIDGEDVWTYQINKHNGAIIEEWEV